MATRKKKHPTVGVFESKESADQAVADLRAAGFDDAKIGMIYREADGKTVRTGAAQETRVEEGAVTGAVAGVAGGALLGAGMLAGIIPVVGPVLALGTLGTILVNAAGGAAVAGLAGALVGRGIPEEDADFYEQEVQNGRYLVTVEASGRALEAREILYQRSGFDRAGWTAVRVERASVVAGGHAVMVEQVTVVKGRGRRANKPATSGTRTAKTATKPSGAKPRQSAKARK